MIDNNRFRGLDRAVLGGAGNRQSVHHRFVGQDKAVLRGGADAGLFLRAIRESKGISRQFVADVVDMGYSSIKRLEIGRPCTTLQTVIDVGSVLGCEVEIRLKEPA